MSPRPVEVTGHRETAGYTAHGTAAPSAIPAPWKRTPRTPLVKLVKHTHVMYHTPLSLDSSLAAR
eukprot:4876905-Amphidinium_carterae.1